MNRDSIELNQIRANDLPRHIAIIMDGNGRWANKHKKPRIWGHKKGVDSVREVVQCAGELGIDVLTLYAFSEENWGRPAAEVAGIMSLLGQYVTKERQQLHENNIRLKVIGDLQKIPQVVRKKVEAAVEYLNENDGMILNIALSYGAKSEIVLACQKIAEKVIAKELDVAAIDAETVSNELATSELPDPDLLIRTSGELRLSNFLLWQLAYAELWFTKTCWPDFKRQDLLHAIASFQSRKRRFGLLSVDHSGRSAFELATTSTELVN